MGNKNGNVTRHYLTAQWRFLTPAQIKALPKTVSEARGADELYYYPGIKCDDHMAIKSRSSFRCVICRDKQRALSKKASQVKRDMSKKKIKKPRVVNVLGMNVMLNEVQA